LSFPRKRESIFFLCSLWPISCNFYPQILINTNKKSGLFFQQAAFLKNLNLFSTANYHRLPGLFRRPPPTKQILSVNLHHWNYTTSRRSCQYQISKKIFSPVDPVRNTSKKENF